MTSHHEAAANEDRKVGLDALELTSHCEADTDGIGAALATALRPGDVLALNGELGAGKTRLVRSIVNALDGLDAPVNSPTFVIVQSYDVRLPVVHVDAYRLADAEEFLALGGEEILAGESVTLIEWAERIADVLPADHLEIEIRTLAPQSRLFQITPKGPRSAEIVEFMKALAD